MHCNGKTARDCEKMTLHSSGIVLSPSQFGFSILPGLAARWIDGFFGEFCFLFLFYRGDTVLVHSIVAFLLL